ncbi:MAG TPA: tol-pal system-associated acyl-CoA thioesterase [Rhodoferax sp.]|jgi:acyl-CoA thioester hydrolase|nr:tol-pal system-associated acyl-CoA thioesterase [Rhodoferax sp.]HPW31095.1 tol-pal system-associated acyl-CoA thioesterase [Rhodoferax sp.]
MHPIPVSPTATVFSWPIRVYWEDTDAGGIVFYANYLKYFERARTEWLRQLGLEQRDLLESTGCIFVVSEANIKYLRPARLDDRLLVTAQLCEMGRSSFTIRQEAHLQQQACNESNSLLCSGSVRIGWINQQTMKPTRIPTLIHDALNR